MRLESTPAANMTDSPASLSELIVFVNSILKHKRHNYTLLHTLLTLTHYAIPHLLYPGKYIAGTAVTRSQGGRSRCLPSHLVNSRRLFQAGDGMRAHCPSPLLPKEAHAREVFIWNVAALLMKCETLSKKHADDVTTNDRRPRLGDRTDSNGLRCPRIANRASTHS